MCLWLAFYKYLCKHPKRTQKHTQSVQLVIKLNKQCFTKRFRLSPYISSPPHHISLRSLRKNMCPPGLKYAWGVHILTAHSVFINTSLCAGNGVCVVFVRTYPLCIWPLVLFQTFLRHSSWSFNDCQQLTGTLLWSGKHDTCWPSNSYFQQLLQLCLWNTSNNHQSISFNIN